MTGLLKTLVSLADQLDKIGASKVADKVDTLIRDVDKELMDELGRRAKAVEEQEYFTDICPDCGGYDENVVDAPWCPTCKGEGFVRTAEKVGELKKISYIRHEKGKWNVYSHKGKRMGSYKTEKEAKQRLRQIEFFKHQK